MGFGVMGFGIMGFGVMGFGVMGFGVMGFGVMGCNRLHCPLIKRLPPLIKHNHFVLLQNYLINHYQSLPKSFSSLYLDTFYFY